MSLKTGRSGLPVVHEHAAGIDVGSRFHVVAVAADAASEPVQTFQAFTADLNRMADWLIGVGVTTVAMESTGVYWVPVYEILEQRGLEVILVNGRDSRTAPGRKTDVKDAQWLQPAFPSANRACNGPRNGFARERVRVVTTAQLPLRRARC